MKLSEIQKKIVGVRVCYDLPSLTDLSRIEDSINTIKLLVQNKNQIILMTHWGRPNGGDRELSTLKILLLLESFLPQIQCEYINQYDLFDKNISLYDLVRISSTKVFLLENTRFDPREQSRNIDKRLELAQKYSNSIDVFVDEAFGVSHREEVTNTELAISKGRILGLSFQKEVNQLSKLVEHPKRPFVVVMGGAKLETKLPLIENMCEIADYVLLGGQLCLTFLQASNTPIDLKNSHVEREFIPQAQELMKKYGHKIILPIDVKYGAIDGVEMCLDIGEQTIEIYASKLIEAKSVFWNGPMGYYEQLDFAIGTVEIARVISSLNECYTVIGGGDTLASVPVDVAQKFDAISMGGGATLAYLAHKKIS
jgi:phosphoglycerate kinase